MALTFVQASPTEAVASGATSVSQAYGVNTTGSSFLLAYGVVTDITAVLTLTDTLGNTWNKIDTLVVAGIQPIVLFWAKNVAGGGANTVTLHSTVSATVVLATAEYTGQAASNPIDVVTHALWNNATASIGPVSTSYTNETLIAFGRVNGGIAITGADGTVRVNGVNAIVLEDRSIPTAGSYTASWTNPNTANNSGFVIGVKSTTSVAGLTFIQAPATESVSAGVTSINQAYGSNTTGSSFLLAYGLSTSVSAVLSMTDTLGNTWNQIDIVNVAGTENIALFWAKNSAGGGANTVTLHSTVSATLTMAIAEYSQAASNPIDVVAHAIWSGTAASIGPITTNFTNEQLIAIARLATGGTAITGADGTVRVSGVSANNVLEDRSIPTTGSYTASWTNASQSNVAGFVVGVKTAVSVQNVYSQPDCRVPPFGPNTGVTVQGTIQYTKQTSSNAAVPPVDSRTTGAPVDSRNPAFIRQNSRTPGTYGPGN